MQIFFICTYHRLGYYKSGWDIYPSLLYGYYIHVCEFVVLLNSYKTSPWAWAGKATVGATQWPEASSKHWTVLPSKILCTHGAGLSILETPEHLQHRREHIQPGNLTILNITVH